MNKLQSEGTTARSLVHASATSVMATDYHNSGVHFDPKCVQCTTKKTFAMLILLCTAYHRQPQVLTMHTLARVERTLQGHMA